MSAKQSALTKKQGDLVMGGVLLAISVFFYIMTYHFTGYDFETVPHDTGPAFVPRLMLACLALESVVLIAMAAMRREAEGQEPARLAAVFQLRPMIMLAAFLVYIFLTQIFGYIIATMGFMVLAFFLLGVRNIFSLLLIPPAITAATYFLFGSVLNIYLPEGSLF